MKIPVNTRPFLVFILAMVLFSFGLQAQGEADIAADSATEVTGSPSGEVGDMPAATPPAATVEDSAAQVVLTAAQKDSVQQGIARGRDLYTGAIRFSHGGPSCLACHNVASADVAAGGLLAKDLTHAYQRLGGAGIEAMLIQPGFPAMARAFENKSLTTDEIRDLKTFLQYVEETSPEGEPDTDYSVFLYGGGIGFIVWMLLISLVYINRKRGAVKADIFNRQTRPVN